MAAGAGLIVQPRALAQSVASAIVQAAPQRKELPPRQEKRLPVRKATASAKPAPALEDVVTETEAARVRRVLANGPMGAGEFLREARLTKRAAMRLVGSGAIVATGVTRGRRYALPGHPAKEAP